MPSGRHRAAVAGSSTFGNADFSVSVSLASGGIVALESLRPSPRGLLKLGRMARPLGLYWVNRAGRILPLRLRKIRVLRNGNRIVGVRESLAGGGATASLVCETAPGGLIRLHVGLRRGREGAHPRLVFFGEPGLPLAKSDLRAFPYSEGVANTGAGTYLRLGSSFDAAVRTREVFPCPCTVAVSIAIKLNNGGAGITYALQPKTGYGYYVYFVNNGLTCWKLTKGGWTTSGNGLGFKPFPWKTGKAYRVKVVGSPGGFRVFVARQKLFDVHGAQFTEGSLGLSAGWITEADFSDVRVISGGKTLLSDDFSSYPVGSGAQPNWEPSSHSVNAVPGYISVSNGGTQWGGYPARFVNLGDRYIVWGQFDLHHPVVFNQIETSVPWVGVTCLPPRGRAYHLNIFIKEFPKNRSNYGEALKWYARRMFWKASSFFPRGQPRLEGHGLTRHLHDGNTIWGLWGFTGLLAKINPLHPPGCVLRMEARAKRLHFKNLVLLDWYSVGTAQARKPIGGYMDIADGKTEFGLRLKEAIQQLHGEGFRVYLYFWPLTEIFNPRDKVYLERYIRFIKKSVEFYHADGVGYDMNWDVGKSILKLQYAIYTWIKKKYPQAKVIIDYGYGGPSEPFADALLCENTPPAYGFPRNAVVASVRALKATLLDLIYFQGNALTLAEGKKIGRWGWGVNEPVDTLSQEKSVYFTLVLKSLALGSPWMTEFGDFIAPGDVGKWEKIYSHTKLVPFPELMKRADLARFSSLATGTSLVTEAGVVSHHPDLVASCWAGPGRLLVDAFRYRIDWHPVTGFWSPQQEAASNRVWLRVDLRKLKRYGLDPNKLPKLKLVVLSGNGLPVKRGVMVETEGNLAIKYPAAPISVRPPPPFQVRVRRGRLEITGYLGRHETLLLYPDKE